jgi:hypothetical protein
MAFPNEHVALIRDPGQFKRLKRTPDAYGDGIDAIFGIRKDDSSALQAIRFKADKITAIQAKRWLKAYKHKVKEFEAG